MRNEDNWEKSTNQNIRFFDEWSKYYVWLSPPPMEKFEKSKNVNQLMLMNVQNNYFGRPLST